MLFRFQFQWAYEILGRVPYPSSQQQYHAQTIKQDTKYRQTFAALEDSMYLFIIRWREKNEEKQNSKRIANIIQNPNSTIMISKSNTSQTFQNIQYSFHFVVLFIFQMLLQNGNCSLNVCRWRKRSQHAVEHREEQIHRLLAKISVRLFVILDGEWWRPCGCLICTLCVMSVCVLCNVHSSVGI